MSRFGVDFLVYRDHPSQEWQLTALEINLRMGGTTQPYLALQFLTGGSLDPSSGLFLSTNSVVYASGSPVVIEITGPTATWVVPGIVRHATKVHPSMMHIARPGMGIELIQPPPALRSYLAAL